MSSFKDLVSTIDLSNGSREHVYNNLKIISNYVDTSLSKMNKQELNNLVDGLKKYLTNTAELILDLEQLKITKAPVNQNVRIYAGPGSGKSTTVIYRIKYLLDNFINSDRIIILTFNVASCKNIKDKIKEIFGFNIKINVMTIDAFCCKLMYSYGNANNLVSLTEYSTIGLDIMKRYSIEITNQYKHVFFDEFQDVNKTQFEILKIFADNGSNLISIGDINQNIYQFRGSNPYFFLNFDKLIKNTTTYFLNNNYRSTASIVNISNLSIAFNSDQISNNMISTKKIDKEIKLIINDTNSNSMDYILNKIKYYIGKGFKLHDIVILSRNSFPLKLIETELTKHNISYIALLTDKNSDDSKVLIEPNKLVLSTVHKAKGLEFEIVFIIGLSHQHWPEHLNNNIQNIEEERRLFYVAITRCKKNLYFVTHLSEFPLSIFIKEIHSNLKEINKSGKKINKYLGGDDTNNGIKNYYGVTEIIALFDENDLKKIRELKLIPEQNIEIITKYDIKLNFIENIKNNSFEGDLGEYCDRYITYGIIKNLKTKFIDSDTESIIDNINDGDNNNIKFYYPKNILEQIKESYDRLQNNNTDKLMNDIYWISLCRNFKLERRRLIYRDIYNFIEENIKLKNNSNSLLNRMDEYIKYFTNTNLVCKVSVRHQFKNDFGKKITLCGEIDLIDHDTLIDFKCSESGFKLEWLIQLLIYYSLADNNNIKKLCIINIMDGNEYFFNILDDSLQYKINLINFLENKIKLDQSGIRTYPSLNYLNLSENNLIPQSKELKNIEFNIINDINYIMILDTETSELCGDILQLAYIIVDNNYNIVTEVNQYIKNTISCNSAYPIHKITIDDLRNNGIDLYDVIEEFIKNLENCNIIVGHNIQYDLNCLIKNTRKYDIKIKTNNVVNHNIFSNITIQDTMSLATKKLGQKFKLTKLYEYFFNKEFEGAHNALGDVKATLACYERLMLL
jgi:DNA polymerase III epsilon subunit-like protein